MLSFICLIINLGIVILLSTSSLNGYGLHRIFKFAHKAGFDGLDITLTKTNFDYWDEDYVKELSDSFNVPVLSITAPSVGMNQKRIDKIVQIATTLGTQIITFSPPHFTDKDNSWFSKYLPKIKRETHLTIAIQNVESKLLYFIIPEYKNASLNEIKKITGDATLDLGSIETSSGMDILMAQKVLGGTIKNIFLNDKQGVRSGLLPGGAGGGISYLPLESFLMKLKTSGYNGFITLKVKPSELDVGTEEKVLQNMKYVISYYKKHFLNYK